MVNANPVPEFVALRQPSPAPGHRPRQNLWGVRRLGEQAGADYQEKEQIERFRS